MKKFLTASLAALLALSVAACFTACGGPEQENVQPDPTAYTVTAEESDYYDVEGQTTSATAGMAAYVKIAPQFSAVKIDKVLFNGEECTASATEANRYEFTMPAKNVEITVEYSFTDTASDNFLAWNSENATEFAMTTDAEEEWYNPQFDTENKFVADVTKSPSGTGGYFTNHEQEAFSTNQSVIPDAALSVKVVNEQSVNSAASFEVVIDRSMVSTGTAQIVLRVENGHKFGDAALLVVTVTITEAAD